MLSGEHTSSGSRLVSPREKATVDVPRLARQRLGLHHGGVRVEALHRFASGDAVVGGDEGQSDVV
jgi:hypothetical protein